MTNLGFIAPLFRARRRQATRPPAGQSFGQKEMHALRTTMLAIPASKHSIKPSTSYPRVFAVLMDWHLGSRWPVLCPI